MVEILQTSWFYLASDVKPFIRILMNLFLVSRNISLWDFDMDLWLFELSV